MRLYLSSYRIGSFPDRLVAMAGSGRALGLILNALDGLVEDVRLPEISRDVADLTSLGFAVTEIDLRSPDSHERLSEIDVAWVRGGNVFVLRRVMADTATDTLLLGLIRRDEILYAGYSAGACVLAPSLRGLEEVDDIQVVDDPIFDGLALLDRPFIPHVRSPGHPETTACDALSARMARAGTKHWDLSDGDVLVIQDHTTEIFRGRS